jgi:large subunit ribosomal protein L10
MPNAEKIKAVAEMKALFEGADSIFITDFQGLNVSNMTELRNKLRGSNVRYLIAKNTLLKIAATEAGIGAEVTDTFVGPTAVAFTNDDPAAAAKILHESFKKVELPVTKVFMVEGEVYGTEEMKKLADLPPKDILLSMVVASVEAPFSQLVGSLDGFFRELVGTIDALAEKQQ